MRRPALALLLVCAGALCAVAVAACGEDEEVTANPDEEVQLRITDTALDPERVEVNSGTIRFRIDNDGADTHQLAVETPNGVEESGRIQAGDTGSLTVELDEGEYTMYDPLEDYRAQGVEGVVVVEGDTDTVTQQQTDTVVEEETDTVVEQQTVTRERTVTQQRTRPQRTATQP
ncbi:MAG TPA: cupredoxin domain-containing protein [Solirubrobacteraceae bacterium]|nr:cupredoxin domain-containing protein [Solirubrobacteraceae bacterium]